MPGAPGAPSSFLLLVAMPLLLVAMPGAPSSVLAPSSTARSPYFLFLLVMLFATSSDARSP